MSPYDKEDYTRQGVPIPEEVFLEPPIMSSLVLPLSASRMPLAPSNQSDG